MSDSVDRVFVHALNTVKKIPRTGSARPPPADRLKLYGLYKQSMEGNVEGVMDRPVGDSPEVQAEKEKWDAWNSQRNVSRTEAKRRYITTLTETMHRYASPTPEARELISELEFVWDQVKSNTSSYSSSPPRTLGVPQIQSHRGYDNIESRMSRHDYNDMGLRNAGRDSRLRVLSPVSQPEGELKQGRRYYEDRSDRDEDEAEEDDEEEFQEARNSPYEDEEQDDDSLQRRTGHSEAGGDIRNRRWRRRVEQALTKMTAEIAAVREQMESRTDYIRRKSSLWSWLRWLVWVAIRQLCWDIALLGTVLIYMRLRGDKRLEINVKWGWHEVKQRLSKIRFFRYILLPLNTFP